MHNYMNGSMTPQGVDLQVVQFMNGWRDEEGVRVWGCGKEDRHTDFCE